jgi:hypothetical protein
MWNCQHSIPEYGLQPKPCQYRSGIPADQHGKLNTSCRAIITVDWAPPRERNQWLSNSVKHFLFLIAYISGSPFSLNAKRKPFCICPTLYSVLLHKLQLDVKSVLTVDLVTLRVRETALTHHSHVHNFTRLTVWHKFACDHRGRGRRGGNHWHDVARTTDYTSITDLLVKKYLMWQIISDDGRRRRVMEQANREHGKRRRKVNRDKKEL